VCPFERARSDILGYEMSHLRREHGHEKLRRHGGVLEPTGKSLLTLVSSMYRLISNVSFLLGSVELEVVACGMRG